MNLPIICFDMDGTLLDEQGRIHPSDVALLGSNDPQALFIPSTGRPTKSVRCAFARSSLFPSRPIPLNMVLQNGALLMARDEVPLAFDALDVGIQKDLLALAMRFPEVTFLFLSSTEIYVLWPRPFGLKLAASFDFVLRPLAEANASIRFSKIMCMSDSPIALDAIAASVEPWPVESALSMPTILEITNYNINKGNGVRRLMQELGLSSQPIYAAGDWGNDLPLFQIAEASFAPATAPEHIKAAASQVIDAKQEGLLGPILKAIC